MLNAVRCDMHLHMNTQAAIAQYALPACTHTCRQTHSPSCPRLNLIQINRGNTGSQSDVLSVSSGYSILHFQNKQYAQQLQ